MHVGVIWAAAPWSQWPKTHESERCWGYACHPFLALRLILQRIGPITRTYSPPTSYRVMGSAAPLLLPIDELEMRLTCARRVINLQEGCVEVRGRRATGPVFVLRLYRNQHAVPMTWALILHCRQVNLVMGIIQWCRLDSRRAVHGDQVLNDLWASQRLL